MTLTLFPRSQEALEYQIWTKKRFLCTLFCETIDGFLLNSHGYIIGMCYFKEKKKTNTLSNERNMHFFATGGAITTILMTV